MARQKDNDRPLTPMERLIQLAVGEDKVFGLDTDPAKLKFPAMWELMTRVHLPENKIVTPAVVSLQLGPEGALVRLVHRDIAHQMGIACPHLEDWATALEAALSGSHPPWQTWGRKEPNLRKRKLNN